METLSHIVNFVRSVSSVLKALLIQAVQKPLEVKDHLQSIIRAIVTSYLSDLESITLPGVTYRNDALVRPTF